MTMLENEENLLLPKLLFLFFLIRDILNKPHNRISQKTFKGIASVKSVFSLLLIPLNGTRLCGNNGRSIFSVRLSMWRTFLMLLIYHWMEEEYERIGE